MDRKMDYPKAAELLQKSIQLKADDPVAHYRLAHVYVRLGKREQADAEFAIHARLMDQKMRTLDRHAAERMSP